MTRLMYRGSSAFGQWLHATLPGLNFEPLAGDSVENEGSSPLLILEGSETPQLGSFPLYLRVLETSEAKASNEQGAFRKNELLMIRGFHDAAQLQAALHQAQRLTRAHDLSRALLSPYSHDVRGSIGVLGLTQQLLAATGGHDTVCKKLRACRTRLEAHLEDLNHLVPTYLGSDGTPAPSAAWSAAIDELREWFEANHRGCTLEITSDGPVSCKAPADAAALLRALVDTLTRTGNSKTPITLRIGGSEVGVTYLEAEGSADQATEEQRQALTQPSETWANQTINVVPYRLRACAVWASVNDARLRTAVTLERCSIRLQFAQ